MFLAKFLGDFFPNKGKQCETVETLKKLIHQRRVERARERGRKEKKTFPVFFKTKLSLSLSFSYHFTLPNFFRFFFRASRQKYSV